MLEKDGSVSIHYKNLRALATEMYRIYNGMAPEIVTETFPLRPQGQYNLIMCVCVCVRACVRVYMYMYVYIYIYMYI